MPVIRDPELPQINAGQLLYGAMPIELLPNGTAIGQIAYWTGTQWVIANLVAVAGINVDYDSATETVSIGNVDYRVQASFSADSVFLKTVAATFTANAVKLKLEERTFTANSIIFATTAASFAADGVLLGTLDASFTADAVLV